MARRTFTDNVINLAVECGLMAHIPDLLTPSKVDSMSDQRLEELAAESADVQLQRADLQDEVDILRKSLEICEKQRPRKSTGRSSSEPFLRS